MVIFNLFGVITGDETGKEKEREDEKVANEEHNNKADDKMEGEGPQNWSEVASFNQKVSLKDVSLHLELCEAFYLSFAIGENCINCNLYIMILINTKG